MAGKPESKSSLSFLLHSCLPKWCFWPLLEKERRRGKVGIKGLLDWAPGEMVSSSPGLAVVWNWFSLGFPGGSEGKAPARNAGDPGSIPRSGSSSGEGNGNPLLYSCLENPRKEEPGETRLSNFPHFTLSDSNVGAFMLHFLYTFLDHVRPLKRILVK